MENIIEKEQELYGITLYNANNEVIYNIAMPKDAGFEKAELKLLETMQEDESIEFATIQRGADYEKNVSKEYPRSYFNHKIKLYEDDKLLDIIETQSLRQGVAEVKLIEAMEKNPKITHGVIGFGNIKEKDNNYNCFVCDKAYLADCYDGAFSKEEPTKERNLDENAPKHTKDSFMDKFAQECVDYMKEIEERSMLALEELQKTTSPEEFKKIIDTHYNEFTQHTLKLGDEIKDYENKFSVLLPDAKVQNYRKIMHNIYKMQDTWKKYKKYFAEKDRTILTDSSTTILNFICNDKYHPKNITNQLK